MKTPNAFKSLLYTGLLIVIAPIVILVTVFIVSGTKNELKPQAIVHTTINAVEAAKKPKIPAVIDTVKPVIKVKKKKIETVIDSVKIKEVKIDSLILNRDSV